VLSKLMLMFVQDMLAAASTEEGLSSFSSLCCCYETGAHQTNNVQPWGHQEVGEGTGQGHCRQAHATGEDEVHDVPLLAVWHVLSGHGGGTHGLHCPARDALGGALERGWVHTLLCHEGGHSRSALV